MNKYDPYASRLLIEASKKKKPQLIASKDIEKYYPFRSKYIMLFFHRKTAEKEFMKCFKKIGCRYFINTKLFDKWIEKKAFS